ncbi:MAG: hypothetical protein EOP88_18940 [Verrucomicrobiaceae bacterium]|nr:MAG: hypothetical protein EOP88_18940 [Verrucomicrobiaceae bacterium]
MTGLTKSLALLNLFGAVVSVGLFVATFFTQGLIVGKARDMALQATVPKLEPVVKSLRSPIVAGKLPPKVQQKLDEELKAYEASPEEWLLEIVENSGERSADFEFPEVRNPLLRKGLDLISRKIAGAGAHFQRSFDNLMLDLRIFTGTNVCAFLLAAGLLWIPRTRTMRHWLGGWTAALMIATVVNILIYVGQDWVWNIMFNRHTGWGYASLHALTVIYLFYKMESALKESAPKEH